MHKSDKPTYDELFEDMAIYLWDKTHGIYWEDYFTPEALQNDLIVQRYKKYLKLGQLAVDYMLDRGYIDG